jgi:hypothetical protein
MTSTKRFSGHEEMLRSIYIQTESDAILSADGRLLHEEIRLDPPIGPVASPLSAEAQQ